MLWETLRAQKDFSISQERPLGISSVHVHLSGAQYSLWRKTSSFFLKCERGLYTFEETQKLIQNVIGDVFCPGRYCSLQKCVYFHTWEENDESCYETFQYTAATFWTFFSRTENGQLCCLTVMVHTASSKNWLVTTKLKNYVFWGNFFTNHNQPHPNL